MGSLRERFEAFASLFATEPPPPPTTGPEDAANMPRMETPYQMVLRKVLSPFVTDRAFMICGPPGTGKTMIAINLIADLIKNITKKSYGHPPPIVLLTFNPATFLNEFKQFREFDPLVFTNEMVSTIDESYFLRQLIIMGYKTFVSNVFFGGSVTKSAAFEIKQSSFNEAMYNLVREGALVTNTKFMELFKNGCIIIADECQMSYAGPFLNMRGHAIDYVIKTHKAPKLVLVTATPIANSCRELVPVLNLLLQKDYVAADFFDLNTHPIQIRPSLFELLDTVGARICMIDNPYSDLYPSYVIEGTKLPYDDLPHFNFLLCAPTPQQKEFAGAYAHGSNDLNIIEHAALATPAGDMIMGINVPNPQVTAAALQRCAPNLDTLLRGSAKLAWLADFLRGALFEPGNILIFTHMIMFPGAILIEHLLTLMGLVPYGATTSPSPHSICLDCGVQLRDHSTSPHGRSAEPHNKFKPIVFAHLNRSISDTDWNIIFGAIQNPANIDGSLIKVCIGTKAINVGVGFPNFNKLIVYNMPSSIAMTIQLIGRLVRPHIVAKLPVAHQTVHIYPLMTIIDHATISSSEYELCKARHEQWVVISEIITYLMSVSILRQILTRMNPRNRPLLIVESDQKYDPEPYSPSAINAYLYPEPRIIKEEHAFKWPVLKPKHMPPSKIITLHSRVVLAMRFIRQLLLIFHSIAIADVLRIAANTHNYQGYNLAALTEEEIRCGALMLVHLSAILEIPRLNQLFMETIYDDSGMFARDYNALVYTSILPYLVTQTGHVKRIVMLENQTLVLVGDTTNTKDIHIGDLITAYAPSDPLTLMRIPITPSIRSTTDVTYHHTLRDARSYTNSALKQYSILEHVAGKQLFWAIGQCMRRQPEHMFTVFADIWEMFAKLGWLLGPADFKRLDIAVPSALVPLAAEGGAPIRRRDNSAQYYPMALMTRRELHVFTAEMEPPITVDLNNIPALAHLELAKLHCQLSHNKMAPMISIAPNISPEEEDQNKDHRRFRRMISIKHLDAKSLEERMHDLPPHIDARLRELIKTKNFSNEIVTGVRDLFIEFQCEAWAKGEPLRYFVLKDDIMFHHFH